MDTKTIDRRVQRTRHALQDALVSLIEERGYEAVTVQAILDRANVGRSTFYAHFRDKEELLLSGFENLRSAFEQRRHERLLRDQAGADTPWEMSLVWFQHAQGHRLLYKALIGRQAGDVVVKYLQDYLAARMRDHTGLSVPAGKGSSALPEVAVYWTVSSLLALTVWWLDHDSPDTAEKINAIFTQLTQPGVEAFWEQTTHKDKRR
jgi:AcrR family transcriptional regulator